MKDKVWEISEDCLKEVLYGVFESIKSLWQSDVT